MNLITVTGPSGVGKDTLVRELCRMYPTTYKRCVSFTTRQPRAGEKDAEDYYFINQDAFDRLLERNAFVETASYSGYSYGLTASTVLKIRREMLTPIVILERSGVEQVEASKIYSLIKVFLYPHGGINQLERQMKGRGDDPARIIERINLYEKEMADLDYFDIKVASKPHELLQNTLDLALAITKFKEGR